MKKFIVFIFGTTYRSLIFFVLLLIAGKILLALGGVGALAVPIDRVRELRPDMTVTSGGSDEQGMLFLVKDGFGISDSISLEVNEIAAPKILTGLGSLEPVQSGGLPMVQARYMRLDGVKLQKFSRSDYVVIGKGTGGKLSGSVRVGSDNAGTGVFLTRTEFYFLCGMFLILGTVVGWLIRYLSLGKKEATSELLTDVESAAYSDPLL